LTSFLLKWQKLLGGTNSSRLGKIFGGENGWKTAEVIKMTFGYRSTYFLHDFVRLFYLTINIFLSLLGMYNISDTFL
jgi:hypothetical protein